MKQSIKKMIFYSLLILTSLPLTGCVPLVIGAAAGAGGVAYVGGNLQMNLDNPVKSVHSAALDVLKQKGVFVTKDELSRHHSEIKGEFQDGKTVRISTKALTERASKIQIRIGVLGDQYHSAEILDAIQEKL